MYVILVKTYQHEKRHADKRPLRTHRRYLRPTELSCEGALGNLLLLPDIRLQIAAITVAEELNFTRAADRLKITQPALSKQIAELEGRLGFVVFKRNRKKVELTDAGQVFIRGCKDALALLEKSVRLARGAQDLVQPVLTIGHCPYTDPALISALLGVHLPLYPNLRLRMESMFALDLCHAVQTAELDFAVMSEPPDNPLLTRVQISTVPLCVAMPADHPAASRQSVTVQDLKGVGWIMFARKSHPAVYERVLEAGRIAGVSPVELHHYVTPMEVKQLIDENGFARAFLKKVAPHPKISSSSGQLLLGLDEADGVVIPNGHN